MTTAIRPKSKRYWDEQVEIDGLSIVSKLVPWLDSNYDN